MPATTQGKVAAIKALANRRARNKDRKRVDNSRLPAGSPMYFDCISCGQEMSVPEDYTTRAKLCQECQALKDMDWLE